MNNSKLSALGIPTSFGALGHTIKVIEIPNLPEMGKYGDWDQALNEIRLFTNGVCDSVIVHSYYHELVHCLLCLAGRQDLSSDEALVDVLGGLLAQVIATSSSCNDRNLFVD